MKHLTRIKTYASIGLTLGLLVGCGGGSSDGVSSSSLAEITPETGELMAKSVSEALSGCKFVTLAERAGTAERPERNVSAELFAETTRQINAAKLNMLKNIVMRTRGLSAREDINQTFEGTCPTSPGNYTIIGTHDDGVDDNEITFNGFCFGSAEEYIALNGKLIAKNVGEPSPTGPIPQYSEMSTNDSGLEITEKSSEGTFNHLVKVVGFKQTFGNGDDDPTEAKPNTIEADSILIRNGRKNNEFNGSDIDLATYDSGEDEIHIINNITFKDPDNGTVRLSSTPMAIDDDGKFKSGSLTATGASGSSATLSPKVGGNNEFTAEIGGEKVGDLNCSELDGENPFF